MKHLVLSWVAVAVSSWEAGLSFFNDDFGWTAVFAVVTAASAMTLHTVYRARADRRRQGRL